jgi:tripartite-type tricarboxylate transporter receptor subunit TctC
MLDLRRRQFVALLGGAAAAWPFVAHAQQAAMPVVAFMSARSPETSMDLLAAFRRGLAENGFVEGTLLLATTASAINTTLFEGKLNYNFLRDIVPIAGIFGVPNVMVVHPSVPGKTVPEFIAYAKANPRKLNMASPGTGSPPHLLGELFMMMTGTSMIHVPYRGSGPALIDLLAGQVQVGFDPLPASIEYVRAGRLRALAVCTATRSHALPDVPTVSEFVPGYESSAWYGIGAPRDTPAKIVEKLNKEINAGLADPNMKARLVDLGGTVLAGSPADFGELIAEETEKWGKVIKFAGIKPE